MAANARETKLSKLAAGHGVKLEHGKAGYRLVNADTGTLVAADWTAVDGYGLDLDAIETALQSMG